jgi:glutathione S-transferase
MAYQLTALVTLAMVATYVWTGIMVGSARGQHKVKAPATEGPDDFNRVYRAHVNTLEQFAAMVPALWVFAYAVGDRWAALLGLVWVVGRVIYVTGYASAADKRNTGFLVTFIALGIAVVGGAGAILWSMLR